MLLIFFILWFFYFFLHFFIVQVQLSPFCSHYCLQLSHPHFPPLILPLFDFVHVTFIYVSQNHSPFIPSHLPSGYCQFVLNFNFVCLSCCSLTSLPHQKWYCLEWWHKAFFFFSGGEVDCGEPTFHISLSISTVRQLEIPWTDFHGRMAYLGFTALISFKLIFLFTGTRCLTSFIFSSGCLCL